MTVNGFTPRITIEVVDGGFIVRRPVIVERPEQWAIADKVKETTSVCTSLDEALEIVRMSALAFCD